MKANVKDTPGSSHVHRTQRERGGSIDGAVSYKWVGSSGGFWKGGVRHLSTCIRNVRRGRWAFLGKRKGYSSSSMEM